MVDEFFFAFDRILLKEDSSQIYFILQIFHNKFNDGIDQKDLDMAYQYDVCSVLNIV